MQLLTWLRLVRLPNTLTTWIDVIAGSVLAICGAVASAPATATLTASQAAAWDVWLAWPAALAALSASLFYAGGMALNDWADREKDRVVHPERPIPSGMLTAPRVLTVALLLFILALILAQFVSTYAHAAAAATLLAIVIYDLAARSNRWFAALAMGACRALSMTLGLMAGFRIAGLDAPLWDWSIWTAPLAYGFLVFVVTMISQFEDVEPGPLRKNIARVLLVGTWIFPALLGESVLERWMLAAGALAITAWILAPSTRRPPIWGLVVRNGVFTLVFYAALWAATRGRYEVVAAAVLVFVLVRFSARLLAQRGA